MSSAYDELSPEQHFQRIRAARRGDEAPQFEREDADRYLSDDELSPDQHFQRVTAARRGEPVPKFERKPDDGGKAA